MDNFLATGLGEAVKAQRESARQEKAELETVKSALGREFPQQDELALVRENHGAVIRELQRMQADANYVSTWTPKTSLTDTQPTAAETPPKEGSAAIMPPAAPPEKQFHTLKYGEGEGRSEYTVSNQNNGYTLQNGYVLRRTYFNSHIGSLGSSLYEDGKWHSTTTAPPGVKLRLFASLEEGLSAAREDAERRGLRETPAQPAETTVPGSTLDSQICRERLAEAGFHPTNNDFYGKNEHELRVDAGDGGIFQMRIFQAAENQIDLRVQYEKHNLIDGSRTVDAQFDTLDEALEFVGDYQKPAERPAAPVSGDAAGYMRGMAFSQPRMR